MLMFTEVKNKTGNSNTAHIYYFWVYHTHCVQFLLKKGNKVVKVSEFVTVTPLFHRV